jgi:hypothetical protein
MSGLEVGDPRQYRMVLKALMGVKGMDEESIF